MVSRSLERLSPRQHRVIKLGGSLDSGKIDRLGNRMQLWIRTVEQDHTPICEQLCKQTGKSTAECLPRPISLTQHPRNFGVAQ